MDYGNEDHCEEAVAEELYGSPPSLDPSDVEALAEHEYIDLVFDGPPSHESGRFVEVETPDGRSIHVGEWVQRPDGYWALRIPDTAALVRRKQRKAWDEGYNAARQVVDLEGTPVWAHTIWPEGYEGNPYRENGGDRD